MHRAVILHVSALVLTFVVVPAGQLVQPFTVGILRHDGILIPFAAFDGTTWTNAWPTATLEP